MAGRLLRRIEKESFVLRLSTVAPSAYEGSQTPDAAKDSFEFLVGGVCESAAHEGFMLTFGPEMSGWYRVFGWDPWYRPTPGPFLAYDHLLPGAYFAISTAILAAFEG